MTIELGFDLKTCFIGNREHRFHTISHVRCLQTEVSHKKNRSIEKDSVRFRVKVTIELGFDSKLFL